MKKQISAFWSLSVFNGLALLVGIFISACAGQIPHPSAAQLTLAAQRWPGATPETLEQGRTLFVMKCSGCHALRRPTDYAPERWPSLIDVMGKRAKLSENQKGSILRYLLVVAEKR